MKNIIIIDGIEYGLTPLSKLPPERTKLFTTEDGVDIYKGDEYWHIISDWTAQKENAVEWGKDEYQKRNIKRFSTREKAEEYVIFNKPCLTLKEIKHWTENYFRPPADISIEYLKELAKSKINI